MDFDIGLIGFGEAGRAFASAGGWRDHATAYDRKTDDAATRPAKLGDYVAAGVIGASDVAGAAGATRVLLSLVTADRALDAARSAAPALAAGTLYCDGNSVAPGTKRAAAEIVEATGGRYVDMAIMAPVDPARLDVPLLLSGPAAADARTALTELGFGSITIAGDAVGLASSIKMLRSVMVKGIEALTAECLIAASRAGVLDAVLASLDASEKPQPWRDRADYNLDRMLVHGRRRAAEMEEVAKTLAELGLDPAMTRGTVLRQSGLGALDTTRPGAGLAAKLALIEDRKDKLA